MNHLIPRLPSSDQPGTCIRDPALIAERWADHLGDESRLRATGLAELHLPATVDEVAQVLCRTTGTITIAGGRTGIAGGAVPIGSSALMALNRLRPRPVLRRREGGWTVQVGAATTLAELATHLERLDCDLPDGRPDEPLFYPVDATEASAQIGGTIATNASGARTFFYGPTRSWVQAVQVVLADGRILELERGAVLADDQGFLLHLADGGQRLIPVVDLPLPPTKHTVGYPLARGMDAIDLFIGSEGTLGVITQTELRLAPRPRQRLYLMQFVTDLDQALAYVAAVKNRRLGVLALEYFGPEALDLVRRRGALTEAAMDLARLPATARGAIYSEAPFVDEPALDLLAGGLTAAAAAAGLDPAHSWAGFTPADAAAMRRLRHALPESVNALIGERKRSLPTLHKVGTDMAVPDAALARMVSQYQTLTTGLETVLFGHIGDGHLHLNILPRNEADLARAKAIYLNLARAAVALGGTVAAEHGIGRLKRDFLRIQYDATALAALTAVKQALDPQGRLNPGVLLPT